MIVSESMIDALRASPCRSRELFERVNVTEHVGREILAVLIDAGIVTVDIDWTLRLAPRVNGPPDVAT